MCRVEGRFLTFLKEGKSGAMNRSASVYTPIIRGVEKGRLPRMRHREMHRVDELSGEEAGDDIADTFPLSS